CLALARSRRWHDCAILARKWLDAVPVSADAALFLLNALKAPGTREAEREAFTEYGRLKARLARGLRETPAPAVGDARAPRGEGVAASQAQTAATVGALAADEAAKSTSDSASWAGGPPPRSESTAGSSTDHHHSAATPIASSPPPSAHPAPPTSTAVQPV